MSALKKIPSNLRDRREAKKQAGLATSLKETNMSAVLDLVTPIARKKQMQAGTVHWFNECVERSKKEVFAETIAISPGLAAEMLKRNPDNRNIRAIKSGQFATDMRAGHWTFNGEPIIVSNDGLINDGQHRLSAVIEANVVIPMLVVFGLDREARLTVDQGSARTASDYLGMEGVENAPICATIARLLIAIEREDYRRLYRESDVTNSQIRARVESDPSIIDAAHYARSVYKYTAKFAAPGVIGTAFYLLTDVNPMEARDYMDRVCVGEGLRRNDPAYAVREALLGLSRAGRGKKLEAIFRGWVKYRCNQPLKIAKVLGSFPALI